MSRLTAAAGMMFMLFAAIAAAAAVRVEAKSKSYFAVGVVEAGRLVIHLSQRADNAPVQDAALGVSLRGITLPAVAQPDGSYALISSSLEAPGEARIDFAITRQGATETLSGTLPASAAENSSEPSGNARQLGWWVLNFAVCIGFLWLFSRRKKSADSAES